MKIKIIFSFLMCMSCCIFAQVEKILKLSSNNFQILNKTDFDIVYLVNIDNPKFKISKKGKAEGTDLVATIYVTILRPIPAVKRFEFQPAEKNFFALEEDTRTREFKLIPQKVGGNVSKIVGPVDVQYPSIIPAFWKISEIRNNFTDWPYYALQVPKEKPEIIHQTFEELSKKFPENALDPRIRQVNQMLKEAFTLVAQEILKKYEDLQKNYPEDWVFYLFAIQKPKTITDMRQILSLQKSAYEVYDKLSNAWDSKKYPTQVVVKIRKILDEAKNQISQQITFTER
ncbi:hypothetical protein M1446_04260 [Candidatus Dependentiae bacterium]|nr:hypothetical protein [Candidatus Dependentiae bacterium]